MSQLQVGQPSANTRGTAAGVSPNHSLGRSAEQDAESSAFILNQPATTSSSNSYTQLQVPAETQTDNSALAEIVTTAIAKSAVLPGAISAQTDTLGASVVDSSASVIDSSAETDTDIIPDTPVLAENPADILLNPSLLAALNFSPLPVLNQLRTEAMQQSAVGLPGFTDTDYKAAVLNNSSAYSNIKNVPLPGADTALPITPMSLQHFIRQATELARPLNHDAAAVSGIAGAQPSGTHAAATEPAFQWKADQLGLQSSQWGQKLVYLLSDKINLQLGQQIQRAQIRLDPPQLGLIELSVSVDGDRTTVQLYASNNQMREAMQQNLDQLRQQLAQRLGSEQLLDIDVRQQSQQQSGQQEAAPEQIAAHFADDVTELSSSASAQLTTGWLNRLV
ncbi:flagellar hook-length control protein FliK [Rheinheimera pacifica]|uniref:flagellar hook-length control protein FliK n=1 Tax=Rheinheimera pacifica TaxID=173990 RepID=UPI002860C48A|nr:flagellar hook-length control protein FliK [Rheinheimera pacifica]MDR6984285.1 flagellar hook-length control protein FliK [Rheinheimera pacifica]